MRKKHNHLFDIVSNSAFCLNKYQLIDGISIMGKLWSLYISISDRTILITARTIFENIKHANPLSNKLCKKCYIIITDFKMNLF